MNVLNLFRVPKEKKQAISESETAAKLAHEKTMQNLAESHEKGNNLKHKLEQNGITISLMAATRHD